MKIVGAEGMSTDQLRFEIQRGAKLVVYQYAISILIMSFRRASNTRYISAGQSAASKGLPLDRAHPDCRMVGNPVGADLLDSGTDHQFQGRQRRHCGNHPNCRPQSLRRREWRPRPE